MTLKDFLEEDYYTREYYRDNLRDILYKYINNKYILDSSLISQSCRKLTNIKLVKCGDYLQLYFYPDNTF